MKNKQIKEILKHADDRTERVISEQFPANWDMESAFQKSYSNYLRQKETGETRRKLFRLSKNPSAKHETGFFLHRHAIAACLLLTLCTTGTILYLQQRADQPEQSVTVQTESIPIAFTEVTVSVTTAPQTKHSETVTKLTQSSGPKTDTTAARTETVHSVPQTVLTESRQTPESSPSDSPVVQPNAEPVLGTGTDLPIAPSGNQTETQTTAPTTTLQTQAQTPSEPEPSAPEPGRFVSEETGDSRFRRIRITTDTPTAITPKQFTVHADGYALTETHVLQNGEQDFLLTVAGIGDSIEVCRYSYDLFESEYSVFAQQAAFSETADGRQLCTITSDVSDSESTTVFIWEQDQSVFMLTTQYQYTDRILTFIENLEGMNPS